MNHFVVFPSADPVIGAQCAKKWISKGYRVLMMLDEGKTLVNTVLQEEPLLMGYVITENVKGVFPGYYRVINALAGKAFEFGADLVTCIGDDMEPPILGSQDCSEAYFSRYKNGQGVMQPCGDPQGKDEKGVPASARICGSPVFGKEWARRAYGGKGPFWDEYRSFYGDEDLHCVAEKCGLLWNNPEIIHLHKHWSFGHSPRQPYHEKAQNNWTNDQQLFFRRKELGFPESEVLV